MDPMSILSEITTVRAVLACVVILGRLLLAAISRRRRATVGATGPRPPRGPAERAISAAVTVAQVVSAGLTILEWLHHTGVV